MNSSHHTSREQKILAKKASPSLAFDSTGNINIAKKQELAPCSLSKDLKLRNALQRRALVYNIASVATFLTSEKWSNTLFERLQQEPHSGYKYVSHEQVLRADKALWMKVAEDTRSNVQSNGANKPVGEAVKRWSTSPEVQYHTTPLPSGVGAPTKSVPASTHTALATKPIMKNYDLKGHKGKGKSKTKGKIVVPDDCKIKYAEANKPICMKYNIETRRGNVRPGKRCRYGFHVCWKTTCHKPHSAVECTS